MCCLLIEIRVGLVQRREIVTVGLFTLSTIAMASVEKIRIRIAPASNLVFLFLCFFFDI